MKLPTTVFAPPDDNVLAALEGLRAGRHELGVLGVKRSECGAIAFGCRRNELGIRHLYCVRRSAA